MGRMGELVQEVAAQQSEPAQVRAGGPDREVVELAARQFGVVARRQLAVCGMTDQHIAHLVRVGWLVRLYRGVYAVGHRILRPEGLWLAAVLACGDGAVLSHRSAAAHWGLAETARARVEVVVPPGRGRGPVGIDVRSACLSRADVAALQGVPVTSVARTLVDLAAVVRGGVLADAVDQAIRLGVYDHGALELQLSRGRAGSAGLRVALADRQPGRAHTRSELERRCLDVLTAAGLPGPEVNVWLADAGYEVDLLWRDARLVVELDGWTFHRSRPAFEADRRRTVELQALGYTVLRFTWRQLEAQPRWVAARVGDHLARSGQGEPAVQPGQGGPAGQPGP